MLRRGGGLGAAPLRRPGPPQAPRRPGYAPCRFPGGRRYSRTQLPGPTSRLGVWRRGSRHTKERLQLPPRPRRGAGWGPAPPLPAGVRSGGAGRGTGGRSRRGERRLRRGWGGSIPAGPLRGGGTPRGRAGAEGAPRPPPPRASADVAPLEIGAGGCPPREQLPPPHSHPRAAELPRKGTGKRGEGEPLRHGVAAGVVAVGGGGHSRTPTCPLWQGAALLPAVAGRRRRRIRAATASCQPRESWQRLPRAGLPWGTAGARAADWRSAPSREGCGRSASARHPARLSAAVPQRLLSVMQGPTMQHMHNVCVLWEGGRLKSLFVLKESKEMREEPSCNAAPLRVCICF